MKIKILQSIAGHAEPLYSLADFSFPPGAVVDIQTDLARAWIIGDIAIAGDRNDKLTMPVEVYTLKPDHPLMKAYRKAIADAEETAKATPEKPASQTNYEHAVLFLKSRGYQVETPADAERFIAGIDETDQPGFFAEMAEFQPKG